MTIYEFLLCVYGHVIFGVTAVCSPILLALGLNKRELVKLEFAAGFPLLQHSVFTHSPN
jgi:hypothetical protein